MDQLHCKLLAFSSVNSHQMLSAETLMQKEIFAKTCETDCENLFNMGRGTAKTEENIPSL